MKDIIAILVTYVVFFLGFTCICENYRCSEVGKTLNYKTEWYYWTGCVVTKPDGNKVLLKQTRDMEK